MTPQETSRAIAAPTGDLGAYFYFQPATVAAGKELGLDGFRFYVLGRGGALGDVPASVVSSAFGYFHPAVVERLWNSAREIVSPPVAAQAYWDQCGARGREGLAGVDDAVLSAYVDAADTVIGATSRAGLPLFAGTADLTCDDDLRGRALQKASTLRELRGSAHLCAVVTSGLSDAQAHAVKRPGEVAAFGWDPAPDVPDVADQLLAAAEDATDVTLQVPFAAASDAQRAALVGGTEAMTAALGDWRAGG